MSEIDTSPSALRALAEAATRGPWQVWVTRHPFSLVRCDGSTLTGEHVERHIVTVRNHPQSRAPYPIVTISVGAGIDDGPPVHKVYIRPEDADYIAAVSPEVVLALLDALADEKEAAQAGELSGISGDIPADPAATVKPDLTVGSPLVLGDFICTPQHAVECAYLFSLAEAEYARDPASNAAEILELYARGDASMAEAIDALKAPDQSEGCGNG